MLLTDPDRPFNVMLLNDYLRPTAIWLLGASQHSYLLPQFGGSNWECALSIVFLIDLVDELDDGDPLRALITSKVSQTAHWMMTQVRHDDKGFPNWEGVTWDTAVCARALVKTLEKFPESFSKIEHRDSVELIKGSIEWLIDRFENWEVEVIYPYGPADVAQILSTLLELGAGDYGLDGKAIDDTRITDLIDPTVRDRTIERIARYLLAAKDDLEMMIENTVESAPFWGDFFQSAEVIDCLAAWVKECDAERFEYSDQDLVDQCRDSIIRHVRYLESHQVDGKWGTHSDTCRALHGYMRASQAIDGVGQEHHVVLKAVRWMCDEKQTFSDGSFLHTSFITVFYVMALWEVYKHWPLARLSGIQVYDLAFWSAPVRATPERGLRLELQIANKRLSDHNQRLEAKIAHTAEVEREQKEAHRKVFASLLCAASVISVGFAAAILTNVLTPDFSIPFKTDNRDALISYIALIILIASILTGLTYRFVRLPR